MHARRTLSAKSLIGDEIVNNAGERVGKLEEIMIDVVSGRIAYAVLSFGGFLGIGDKLFALPWSSLVVDEAHKRLIANVSKELLAAAPGFDKHDWPDLSSVDYARGVYRHYGAVPYWE